MSFFEVSPMGSGIAVGGRRGRSRVSPKHMGGISVGGVAMSKEDRAKNARNMKKLISARAKLIESEYDVGKNQALGMAKDEIQAELKSLGTDYRKAEKGKRITKVALKPRLRKYRDAVELEAKGKWTPLDNDLRQKGLTKDQLSALDAKLKAVGFGIYDMETGSAWYDDLWSGVKDVGKTALQVAPHLLPLLL
jgi:hypothetical protein